MMFTVKIGAIFWYRITYVSRIFGVIGKNYLNYLWCLQSTLGEFFWFRITYVSRISGVIGKNSLKLLPVTFTVNIGEFFWIHITYDSGISGVIGKNSLNYLWCLQSILGKQFGSALPIFWEFLASYVKITYVIYRNITYVFRIFEVIGNYYLFYLCILQLAS